MFDAQGQICRHVTFVDLARHVYFSETGQALGHAAKRCPLIGTHGKTAYYLLFNGILGDKSVNGGNVLTDRILRELPAHPTWGRGIRGWCSGRVAGWGPGRLEREAVVFKQLPYEIKVT